MAATIKSSFYHPQHVLLASQFPVAGGSIYACAACELRVTGTGYRCDECDFNIHEACFTDLPGSISLAQHRGHELTLTRLAAASRCDACKETSRAGRYMYYCCAPCNYGVHPRCTSLVAQPPQRGGRRKRRSALRTIKVALKITVLGFKVVNIFTGGFLSPVLDGVGTAIDIM